MKSEYHKEKCNPDGGVKYIEWWGEGSFSYNPHILKLHRIDGHAIIYTLSNDTSFGQYYLLGYYISEDDFNTPGFIDSFILEHS